MSFGGRRTKLKNNTVLESNKYLKINFEGGNLSSDAGLLLIKAFACKRGTMENYIKENKNGFDFVAVMSSSKIVNANRLQNRIPLLLLQKQNPEPPSVILYPVLYAAPRKQKAQFVLHHPILYPILKSNYFQILLSSDSPSNLSST